METLGNANLLNSAFKYYCNCCDYGTCKKSSFNDHILSAKHKRETECKQIETPGNAILPKLFFCENCEKEFKNRSGLWKHNKNCKNKNDIDNKIEEPTDKQLMMMVVQQNVMLIKENQEFKNLILEIVKKDTTINNTTTHTNSHNKTFNLQFFLNETCKDAMNIMDFVDSIKLQLSDLERVGELGYVEGISSIITSNLKALDVTQRPVHCTDKKRDVLYIKDENKWEKEDEEKKKIHKVIKKVALKNQRMIPKFKEEHPDCGKSTSKFSDQYNKIIMEAMGGLGNNDKEKEERIVKNISKHVTLDKE